ncbi:hypothetical protein [Avibacterium endocarditidis]|uniref:DUF4262 domain-containing protein n=1 Tax=Avibacterium endocarditidis TaxID=380674 RepID=A0ABX4ZQZ2_9PAST|nr:hypothetical protein [Avibacterium endocarditidis]POY41887.1 hypothetical protein C3Z13_09210 [Avibacterium endocarditidis]
MEIEKLEWKPTNEVLGAFIVDNDDLYIPFIKGTHNGYILLGILHPLYKLDYVDINKKLYQEGITLPHGEITFGKYIFNFKDGFRENIQELFSELDSVNYLVLGFDTCHLDDNSIKWDKETVTQETINFAKTMAAYDIQS